MPDETGDLASRMRRIESRFDWLDEHGTRAVNVLALQVSELTKDFGELKGSVDTATKQMRESKRIRVSSVLGFIALMVPLYALVLTVFLSSHGGH